MKIFKRFNKFKSNFTLVPYLVIEPIYLQQFPQYYKLSKIFECFGDLKLI